MKQRKPKRRRQTTKELSPRWQRLVDELPLHAWNYSHAGMAAGYSRAYATTSLKTIVTRDDRFCKAVQAKQAEINAQTTDKREGCLRVLDEIIQNVKSAPRDRIRATEVRGKMSGWLSETRVYEIPSRQRELTEAEQEEVRRLALLRFDTTRLPGKVHHLHGMQSVSNAAFEPNNEGAADMGTDIPDVVGAEAGLSGVSSGPDPGLEPAGDGLDGSKAAPEPPARDPITPQSDPGAPFSCLPRDISDFGNQDTNGLESGIGGR